MTYKENHTTMAQRLLTERTLIIIYVLCLKVSMFLGLPVSASHYTSSLICGYPKTLLSRIPSKFNWNLQLFHPRLRRVLRQHLILLRHWITCKNLETHFLLTEEYIFHTQSVRACYKFCEGVGTVDFYYSKEVYVWSLFFIHDTTIISSVLLIKLLICAIQKVHLHDIS